MTLIITTIRPHDIIVTSDSRATLEKGDAVTGVIDTYQKIFPSPDHPVVISHHGENELGGKPLGQFIAGFASHLNAGDLTILDIADQFRAYAHAAVRACLRDVPPEKHGCGFLIAGFGADDHGPSVVELFWKRHGESLATDEQRWVPTAIIFSGSGSTQAGRTDWHDVAGKPLEKVCAYNERLLDGAIHANVPRNSVGGPMQEIVIQREKWEWLKEPPKPAPTTRP